MGGHDRPGPTSLIFPGDFSLISVGSLGPYLTFWLTHEFVADFVAPPLTAGDVGLVTGQLGASDTGSPEFDDLELYTVRWNEWRRLQDRMIAAAVPA